MTQKAGDRDAITQEYQHNIDRNRSAIQKIKNERKNISIARFIVVIVAFGFGWYVWPSVSTVFVIFLLSGILFTMLVFRDVDKLSFIKNYERLVIINQHELDAIGLSITSYDDGHIFSDPAHAYASDLDLFGPSSLYQWLSRCHAEQSKLLLADRLKAPPFGGRVKKYQEAAKELSVKQASCQQFQSHAIENPLTYATEKKLKDWAASPAPGFEKAYWKWVQHIYPIVPVAISLLFAFDYISNRTLVLCLVIFYVVYMILSRKINPEFAMLFSIESEVDTIYKQIRHIENEKFNTELLQSIQSRLSPTTSNATSTVIRDFHRILKKIEFRSNLVVSPILQFFLIWDIRQVLALNDWKKKNKLQLNEWFTVVSEMEVLVSVASLVHNEPDWCFPQVDDNFFHFDTENIGHPLIKPASRISNNFEMEGTGRIALITGSNMAGKSTFLRSLGVNTVLALMGAPVCADKMNICNMHLISSMRVADNLSENTSTFYAELKKLQYIIESVNRGEHSLILLDEVLRGTNSTDRHKGSKALVKQLLKENAVAVMATHDTELAHSESSDKSVSNYHFEGRLIQDELFFDYKIKKGICESLNATALMKKIGIHFQD